MKYIRQPLHALNDSLPLRGKLILAFVALALLPIAMIGFYADFVTHKLINDAAENDLANSSNQTAQQIDSYILSQMNSIRTEAQQPFLGDYLELPAAQRKDSLQELNASQILVIFSRKDPTFINSYALLDEHGMNLLDTEERQIGNDESNYDYFTTAFAQGLPFASTILFQQDNDFFISAPVRNEKGETIGVLRAEYDAVLIQSMLLSILSERDAGDFISVIDRNTYVRLADTGDSENLYKSLKNLSPAEVVNLQSQHLLPHGKPEDLLVSSAEMITGMEQLSQHLFFETYSTSIQDNALITGVALQYVPWMVLEGRSQAILSEPIKDQRRTTILMTFLILFVAVFAALPMSSMIARPVVNLTSVAKHIASGDLATVADRRAHV